MPARRRRKASIHTTPGLKQYNLKVDASLLDIDWITLAAKAKKEVHERRIVPQFRDKQTVLALRQRVTTRTGLLDFYNTLPPKIDKFVALQLVAATQSHAAFAQWYRRRRRSRRLPKSHRLATTHTNANTAAASASAPTRVHA